MPLLLEGQGDSYKPIQQERDRLRDENSTLEAETSQLRAQVESLKAELRKNKRSNEVAIQTLRAQLEPLYRALQAVFGQIELIAGNDTTTHVQDTKSVAVWDSWKSRLGGTTSKVIDALLTHGDLNTQQLSMVTGLHRTTIPSAIFKLNKAGLINKNSGRFSLKTL
jgi:hypothetical protein